MFELSHRLIGIYKTANATRSTYHAALAFSGIPVLTHRTGISIDNHALTAIPTPTPVAS